MRSVLHVVVLLAAMASALEVRVLTGLGMRGQASQPDMGDQRLVLNSNNRNIYPT
jgi:hypothetical protein